MTCAGGRDGVPGSTRGDDQARRTDEGEVYRAVTKTRESVDTLVRGAWGVVEREGLAGEYASMLNLPRSRIRDLFLSPTVERAKDADPVAARGLWLDAVSRSAEIGNKYLEMLEFRDEANRIVRSRLETSDLLFRGTHSDELDSILSHRAVGVGAPSARGGNRTGAAFGFVSLSVLEITALDYGDILLRFDAAALRAQGAVPVTYDAFATKQGSAHESMSNPMSLAHLDDLEVRIPRGIPLRDAGLLSITTLSRDPGAADELVAACGSIAACAAADRDELRAKFAARRAG